jgi:enamine deaminase RidA (YjgF/YER057c/UK114 family)
MRQIIGSGFPFEDEYGYSRAVRIGQHVFVSGTIARGEALEGDAYVQSMAIYEIVRKALAETGAEMKHVVRTVIYATDILDEPRIAKAHSEIFDEIRPASTFIEIKKLRVPKARVEIELTAVID